MIYQKRMTIRCSIREHGTHYEVCEFGIPTYYVLIMGDANTFLGEIIELHDRARDLGLSDGTIPQNTEGENL